MQPPPAADSQAVADNVFGLPIINVFGLPIINVFDLPIINVFDLPIINAAAHEWSTLVTALDQLTRLNELVSGPGHKLVATLDMDLRKRALKLEHLDPQFKNKWVLCPDAFHTLPCALQCLGRTIEGSGLVEAWQEADMYSSVTVTQIFNGNHHNRASEAHQITLQACLTCGWKLSWKINRQVKLLSWNTVSAELKLKAGSEVFTLKATSSLFARMLVIARSSRDDIDLEEVIELRSASLHKRVLMKPGSIHHTSDKSIIIHLLDGLVNNTGDTTNAMDDEVCPQICLVVDVMGVVQELKAVGNFKNYKEFGATYVKLIDSKARGYDQVRVIFDNYTVPASLKEGTRQRRRGKSTTRRGGKLTRRGRHSHNSTYCRLCWISGPYIFTFHICSPLGSAQECSIGHGHVVTKSCSSLSMMDLVHRKQPL